MPSRAKRGISAALEAARLLGRWTRLAQGHAMLGAGCSCGLASGPRPADFEPQILDRLKTKHGISGFSSVAELLRSIAKEGESGGGRLALLADLSRGLDSFEALHGARADWPRPPP